MTTSETQDNTHSNPAVTALVTQKNADQIVQNASTLARKLSDELRGGKSADTNVTRAAATANDLQSHFHAIQHNYPHMQKQRGEPTKRPDVIKSDNLHTIIGATSSDARYLKSLTAGGIGMSRNVVEPLRVLRELREKLAFIQNRWSELQTDDEGEIRMTPIDGIGSVGLSRQDKTLQKLIASGEVNL